MTSILIFLTGCINPNGMALTMLQNPETRRQQYIDAIRFYLEKTKTRILFVENSGVDLSSEFLDTGYESRLEILTFQGNGFDRKLGKGYGEISIIDHALKHSKFLDESYFVFKITGRYQILNIQYFIEGQLKELDKVDLMVDLLFSLTFADSRFWGCKKSFLSDFFVKHQSSINDTAGVLFENALCKASLHAIASGYNFTFFRSRPWYLAVSGTSNKVFKESRVMWWVKNFKHRARLKLMNSF